MHVCLSKVSMLGKRCVKVIVPLQEFQKKLVNAKRIVVLGNGGIATELV